MFVWHSSLLIQNVRKASNMAELTQIRKVNVSQATFNTLLDMVMDGTWKQGQKIPSENELKDMLAVSRHTVRAAINNLNMLGILETRQGDGNYVKANGIGLYMDFLIPHLFISKKDLESIIEFRESIEATIARYAALRATEDDIKTIHQKLVLCEGYCNNLEQYLVADFDFHYAIAEASKNVLLIQCMYIVKKHYFPAVNKYFDADIALDGTSRHRLIFEAIEKHDSDKASQHMDEHIRSILQKIKNRIALEVRE